ncbi:hypothetical protein [Variovorax sp. RTB1]|jgi:hypothetical protein|uniref:hypothetical protein n=1 Tax=Variovorax sp. RTB1 TaxID=3048631 RepID=UPI002B2340EC|nr:hypothetical protein [Variovorax sp. RTB1]
MFIVWGRKIVRRTLGYVADFCPICRAPTSFELQRVGSAGHIYYISAGEGALVGFERRCTTCKTAFHAEPSTYASVASAVLPLPELVAQTFPGLYEAQKARLELEAQVRHSPFSLSPEDRRVLIRNPFLLLSPTVEKRYSATHLDLEIGLAILGAFILVMAGASAVIAMALEYEGAALLVLVALGFAMVGWQFNQSGPRFMRRQVIPVLATTLMPLKPTTAELQTVIDELKRLRHKIGSKLRLTDLTAEIEKSS